MGNICTKDNTKVVENKTNMKLPYSYDFDIHRRYHFHKVINHGAFGQVKLYSDRIFSGTEYAIKCITKIRLKPNKIRQIKNEIDILSSLDHPNIVTYFCTVEDNKNYYILMEYLSGKDLEKIFRWPPQMVLTTSGVSRLSSTTTSTVPSRAARRARRPS